jgi:hypothetical protein
MASLHGEVDTGAPAELRPGVGTLFPGLTRNRKTLADAACDSRRCPFRPPHSLGCEAGHTIGQRSAVSTLIAVRTGSPRMSSQEYGATSGRGAAMNRYLFEFREADGHVTSELLYFYSDGAGPVGPDGLPLSNGRTLAMYGREWRVEGTEPAKDLIRISCVAVSHRPPAGEN